MTVGSLFSGVGGLDLGLARAGWRHAWFCEADAWRRSILSQHWPGVPIHEDVHDVGYAPVDDGRPGRDARPPRARLDLICGGFPCQDVSVAGRRKGLAGDRSGLWHQFARVVDAFRPRAVLVENVPGLLSSNGGRDMGVILDALAGLGYGLAWRVLDAQHFGVPQRRRRVFLLALPDGHPGAIRAGEILAISDGGSGDTAAGPGAGAGDPPGPTRSPNGGRVARGTPLVAGTIRASPGGVDDNYARLRHIVAHTLTRTCSAAGGHAPDEANYVPGPIGVRRLTPRECERLMGWPDDWTAPGPDTRRYAACGDGVAAPVAQWIGERLARHLQEGAAC